MSNTNTTLQNVVNLAATHAELMPLAGVGGYTNEPALSLCNDVMQELLSAPFPWKFNRVELPMLVTAQNKQDYLFAGAVAFTLGSSSTGAAVDLAINTGISESTNTVTVNTLEPHNFNVGDTVYMSGNTVAAYNSTFSQTASSSTWSGGWTILTIPSSTSFTFTHVTSGLATSGAAGITDFGWLEDATMTELNNTSSPLNTRVLKAVRNLQPSSRVSNPDKVCLVKDLGTGVLKFRFLNVPGSTIWAANLVYQAKATPKTSLIDTWAPIPDEFGFVYRQAFLARCYRFIESPRADVEYQKSQAAIMKALGKDDSETSEEHIAPECGLMDF